MDSLNLPHCMAPLSQASPLGALHDFRRRVLDFHSLRLAPTRKFIKFCLVGGSGLGVDMVFLFLLADPRGLGFGFVASKILSAELAMVNNFIWNELWTFRKSSSARGGGGPERDEGKASARQALVHRFLVFNVICGMGIGLAVFLLHVFYAWLGWDLYVSNFLAIVLVTFWNFALNVQFNWNKKVPERFDS